jgi:hypothetical protein
MAASFIAKAAGTPSISIHRLAKSRRCRVTARSTSILLARFVATSKPQIRLYNGYAHNLQASPIEGSSRTYRSSPDSTSDSRGSSATGAGGRSQLVKRPVWFRGLLSQPFRFARRSGPIRQSSRGGRQVGTHGKGQISAEEATSESRSRESSTSSRSSFELLPDLDRRSRGGTKRTSPARGNGNLRTHPSQLE